MTDALKSLVDLIARNARFNQRASTLIAAAVLLIALMAAIRAADASVAVQGIDFTATLAVLSLLIFLGGIAMVFVGDRLPVLATEVRARGGSVLLGIDVGADWIRYGVVNVTSEDLRMLPPDRAVQETDSGDIAVAGVRDGRLDGVVNAIVNVCKERTDLYGIGLGLPGQIDPVDKRILNPSGPFQYQERFVDMLVERLVREGALVQRGLQLPEGGGAEAIRERVLIDHHVRCYTRAVLSRYRNDARWRNFIFINVDWGVGSGMVIDRRMYYGSAFTAGEVGHMTLNLEDEVPLPAPALRHMIDPCQCQMKGVHWESLVSAGGLLTLARVLDPPRFAALANGFDDPLAPDEVTPEHLVVACMAVEERTPEADSGLPDVTWKASEETETYARTLLECYAFYLAVGIADLLNVLNLDHVLMGGYVMRALWPLNAVRKPFRATLNEYVLSEAGRTAQFVDASSARAWPGAALLWRDPSYELMLETADARRQ
jgi:predicted NBD/HSP70 family sugar kinase